MNSVKKVNGFTTDGESIKGAEVKCRFTSNKQKEILSFEVDGFMIGVNFEDVEKIIEHSRRRKNEPRNNNTNQRRTRIIREG